MKTLTLQVRTAVQIAPGVYDATSEIVQVSGVEHGLYVQALGLPAAMGNIMPASVKLCFTGKAAASRTNSYATPSLQGKLDIAMGVYPEAGQAEIFAGPQIGSGDFYEYKIEYGRIETGLEKLLNGAVAGFYGWESSAGDFVAKTVSVYGSASQSRAPYLEIGYEEGTLTTYGDSPAGFVNRGSAQTFRWHTAWSGFPADDVAQTSATLQWKDGESGTLHEISISGSGTTYNMAANTLPVSGDILWRVNAVTAEGNSEGRWAHLRTQDALSTPVGVAPSSGYVNGTDVVRFIWRHEIATGTEQTGWEIQVKGTGDWTALASGSGADQYYDAPAGSVPSGAVQWRVRTLNAQGTAGSWSEALQIVVIGAPTVTALQVVTASPRPEVTWASPDQQAFQIQMGSYDSGLVFGTQKRFKCPVYLPGTGAEIRVRVINEYRIWSDWASITVAFANTPETPPDLTVEAGRDAVLSWGLPNAAEGRSRTDRTTLGVQFVWNQAQTVCTVTRTASGSGTASTPLGGNNAQMIDGLAAGRTYHLRWDPSAAGVRFGIYIYKNGSFSSYVSMEYPTTERDITIPSDAGGAVVVLTVSASASPNGVTATGMDVREAVSYDRYLVFRDGVQIGETDGTTFIDQTAAPGRHSWYVRCVSGDGDTYTDTAAVQAEVRTDSVIIAELGGEWLDIGMTATVSDDTGETRSAGVAMLQLAGNVYPTPEVSPRRQRSYQIAFGTEDPAEADRFEELVGKICVLKTRHGRQYVGVMSSISRSQNWAITRCSATIQEVDESAYH